ncbi:pyridoxal-phosphate dependent enzyme family protein [Xylariaceae sp. FL0804]|nr:pyridoxal-phosphate dependent enzyme family protein [Xylariaceae sp. FL0804]
MPSSSLPSLSPSIYLNPEARHWTAPGGRQSDTEARVLAFHQTLPDYTATPLRPLPSLARELGLGAVLVKDESSRLGLPAFKILGASWAVYRAVAARLGVVLPPTSITTTSGSSTDSSSVPTLPQPPPPPSPPSIAELGARATAAGLSLVTCTDGNCGRAVARMARLLGGLPTRVHVPRFVDARARARIRGEGAEVLEVNGSYDDAIPVARAEAGDDVIMVLDVSLEGYDEIPQYFVQGYSTMLAETDQQVLEATGGAAATATHVFVPCGAGSVSQAVTTHYKSLRSSSSSSSRAAAATSSRAAVVVVAVEPVTAACLQASLRAGRSVTVPAPAPETGGETNTIMTGLNCGTLSAAAWPVLRRGVDAAVTVTDAEAHAAVGELARGGGGGIRAGPCGAAAAAALRRVCADAEAREQVGLGGDSVVVLFCTEGEREYEIPA